MRFKRIIIQIFIFGQSVLADKSHVPLPGLETKPHLQHLQREDLALEKLFESTAKTSLDDDEGQVTQQERYEMENAQALQDALRKAYPEQSTAEFDHIKHGDHAKHKHRRHPQVQSSSYCGRAVDRLKAGPANIPDLICKNEVYTDSDFSGANMIYWTDYNTYGQYSSYQTYMNSGTYYIRDWSDVYTSADIFDSDGSISYDEAIQGGLGSCYVIASLGSMGEFPDHVKNLFVTKNKNSVKAIAVRFYIRGKPWVVTVNEEMLFMYSNPRLKFAQPAADNRALWNAIIEKAWAKMKGNYLNAEGGLVRNGLSHYVGIPVFHYQTSSITDTTSAESMFDTLVAADAANYLMGLGTAGSGNDQENNNCGIAMSHAYSLVSAFTMTDSSGTAHKVLLVRNPWGVAYYNQEWNKNDAAWTDALVNQVPFGIDVRTEQASKGFFVVPIKYLIGTDCFGDIQIGHERASEGYADQWYDQDNAVDANTYSYTLDRDSSISSDMYFMVQTYAHEVVPTACTTGSITTGQSVNYPVAYFQVYNGGTRLDYKYYVDQGHNPMMIPASTASAVTQFSIYVNYEFIGSPHRDFTLKVYSKNNQPIKDAAGNQNVVHMDGQQPSGFTSSTYIGMDNWDCSMSTQNTNDGSDNNGGGDSGGDGGGQEEERDVSTIEVKSLLDVFNQAESFEEFFGFIWYNPQVMVIWFHWW